LSVVAIAAGKRTRRDVVSIWWFEMPFGCTSFYSTPIPAPDATPASHVTPHRFRLVAQRHIRSCRPGWSLPGLIVRRFQFPDRFPSMPVCPKENRPCPFRPARAACVAQAVTRAIAQLSRAAAHSGSPATGTFEALLSRPRPSTATTDELREGRPVMGYQPEQWHSLFEAIAGARPAACRPGDRDLRARGRAVLGRDDHDATHHVGGGAGPGRRRGACWPRSSASREVLR
jgi:hypothetical protein